MARCTPPQLSLFDAALHQRVEKLEHTLTWLHQERERLAAELAESHRDHKDALAIAKGLAQRVETLRQTLALAQEQARGWQLLYELAQRPPQPHHRLPDVDHLLSALTKLCHPDRWEHQPATTLAHEAMVLINHLRQQAGGGR